jgi:GMP synthase (glutamine-hydrolysing)
MCSEKLHEKEFVKPIEEIVKKNKGTDSFETKNYLEVGYVEDYDKIILCGTAIKDNEFLDHINKFYWLKNTNREVLGICSGMQIMGLIFGAEIINKKEIGMVQVRTKRKNKLFSKTFEAYNLHEKSLKNLKEFEIIGNSKESIQAIKHKEKPLYGILFHPEVRNEKVIKKFID